MVLAAGFSEQALMPEMYWSSAGFKLLEIGVLMSPKPNVLSLVPLSEVMSPYCDTILKLLLAYLSPLPSVLA